MVAVDAIVVGGRGEGKSICTGHIRIARKLRLLRLRQHSIASLVVEHHLLLMLPIHVAKILVAQYAIVGRNLIGGIHISIIWH